MQIEVCAANIQSALAAQKAGAQRIELCSALDAGGLTPSAGLIYAAIHRLNIAVNVLIRPREGDFHYSRDELTLMLDDIAFCQDAPVHGIVIGALDAHGHLDLHAMEAMVASAEGLDVTCHRAFDFVKDPFAALEALIGLGVRRVLTSGQAASAWEGRFLIQKLVEKAAGRISIMPGAGITPQNIGDLATVTGAQEFHLSGRKKVEQKTPGKAIPGLESGYWASSAEVISEAVRAVSERN